MPIFATASSVLLSIFTNQPANPNDQQTADYWTLFFIFISIADFIVPIIRWILYFYVEGHISRVLRAASFEAILCQEISFFDKPENGTGALARKLDDEVDRVAPCVGGKRMALLVQAVGAFGVGIIVALTRVWQVTLVALACVPALTAGVYWELMSLDKIADDSKEAHEESCLFATDTLKNIRTVYTLGLETTFVDIFDALTHKPYDANMLMARNASIGVGFKEAMQFVSYAVTFWYGGRFILDGSKTPEDVLMALFVVLFSSQSIGWMYYALPAFAKGRSAAASIFHVIDRKPRIPRPTNGFQAPYVDTGVFDNVHFAYPLRKSAPVLKGIDVKLWKGKTVALVGASGSGKSTVVSLLLRLYDATFGSVSMASRDVKDWDLDQLRGHMSLVSQEPVLFSGSIRDNIAYGALDGEMVTLEQIQEAAKMANIHDFIISLPDGYDTILGDIPQTSGGQKQRIAIARSLVRKPDVLLLDEATSALDSGSEKVVEEALKSASEGRMVVSIAHRLSTIQHADVILVVSKGEIMERGTHQELLAMGGVYTSMVMAQAQEKKES
ncbi:Multidrug resistance protein 1 [Chytridiales sp. JEL 0842]|nr:Multidrug resistance protein 1 [Chytridiales sp. JEL 0842]